MSNCFIVRIGETSIYKKEYQALIRNLVSLRKAKGLSQKEIALVIGLEQSHISKIENCERRLDVLEFLILLKELKPSAYEKIIDELDMKGSNE